MYPTLLIIGPLAVSSFGFFLVAGVLSAAFIVWRLAKIYDLNEEKIIDIFILTCLGGIIGARLYFVIANWNLFNDLSRAVLLNRYPGLSFWGGLLAGVLTLKLFVGRSRFAFWQIADFASVGFALAAALGNIGCALSGCGYGAESSSLFSVSVVGLIGRRFPVPALEAVLFLILFVRLWKQVIRFHFNGRITAVFLMFLGIIKFISEFFRGEGKFVGYIFPLASFIAGILIFYHQSKRSFVGDLQGLIKIFGSEKKRGLVLVQLKKSWYNHQINFSIKISKAVVIFQNLPKSLKRRLNVRENPKNLGQS